MGLGYFLKQSAAALIPRGALVRGTRARPEIAITFDDGPHPEQTPRLLDVLAREGVLATFFLQGDHAAKWPEWVRKIHLAGHQIANHSYAHIRARDQPVREFVQDVERTHDLLQDIVGVPLARDFRPPYGNITARTFVALATRGYRSVFWTVDSADSFQREVQALVSHISTLNISNGDIVLFHEDYAHTVTAMPAIIAGLRAAGLMPRKVDQL